jgi:hypothetical protein
MKLTKLAVTKRALVVGLLAGSGILAASAFAMSAGGPETKGAATPTTGKPSTPGCKRTVPNICPS